MDHVQVRNQLRAFDKKVADQLHRNVFLGYNAYDTCLLMAQLDIAAGEKKCDVDQGVWDDRIDYLRTVLWASVPEREQVDCMRHLVEEVERLREGGEEGT